MVFFFSCKLRTTHNLQSRTIVERQEIRFESCLLVVVHFIRSSTEIPHEKVLCCFKVKDVQCNMFYSHIYFLKSLFFSHSLTGTSKSLYDAHATAMVRKMMLTATNICVPSGAS